MELSNLTYNTLYEILKVFKRMPKRRKGICGSYIECFNIPITPYIKTLLEDCCIELGIYSGSMTYPISHPYYIYPAYAYSKAGLWNPFTIYGRRRWRVRNLMLKKIKQELKNKSF